MPKTSAPLAAGRRWGIFLALALTTLGANPAFADCPDPIMAIDEARPLFNATWNGLSHRNAFPWGGSYVWGSVNQTRINMALPWDRLSADHKRQALDMLQLGGTPATLYQPDAFDRLTVGRRVLPYTVFAHDGRVVSMPYDGCTRLYFFTERDREKLRWMGRTPPARVIRYPLPRNLDERYKALFWKTVGKQSEVLHISWVPEQGHYEIVVSHAARFSFWPRLEAFWWKAPLDLHYVILDSDGNWLDERGPHPLPIIWQGKQPMLPVTERMG